MQLAANTASKTRALIPLPCAGTSADFLKSVPLFKAVPEQAFRAVAESVRTVPFRRGTRIFVEGQQPSALYIVRQGWVRTVREPVAGHGVLFEILRPGDTVGISAFADGGTHVVTAIAGSQVELLAMPASVFNSLCTRYPEIQRNFIAELGRRTRSASDWQIQAGLGVDGRIARIVLRMAEWNGTASVDGIVLPKSFTCQELAEMAGCAVETGIRMLSSWRQAGWLSSSRSALIVHDLDRLEELAGREMAIDAKTRLGGQVRLRGQMHSRRACA